MFSDSKFGRGKMWQDACDCDPRCGLYLPIDASANILARSKNSMATLGLKGSLAVTDVAQPIYSRFLSVVQSGGLFAIDSKLLVLSAHFIKHASGDL